MISINDIVNVLYQKNPSAIPAVNKAYILAENAHKGIFRESGEPYITHPLNVAKILLDVEVYDEDTICAALLHDTVEDCDDISLDDIANYLNPNVAELVDGVTKMRRMFFSTKADQNDANTRKIINGLTKDVRIILIKLADRIHNMQTLQFKNSNKQKEIAAETMELYVPLALTIGAYQIKSKLEDLALMYLEPDAYKQIDEKRNFLREMGKAYLHEIKYKIEAILHEKNISSEIILRQKNICNIYKQILKGYRMENIYDLFYLKILVEEVDDCYRTLSYVHRNNPPINGRFKDYIYNPRTNYYQSLHTTVSGPEERLIKVKIRTFDMDKVSAFGISAYWNINPNKPESEIPLRKTYEETQTDIRNTHQFTKKLQEIDSSFKENAQFIKGIKKELLTDHVYVYKNTGESIELPVGATALDFACEAYSDSIHKLTGVIVNGKQCKVGQILKNYDRVQIETDGLIDRSSWNQSVTTMKGKRLIRLLTNRQNPNQVL